MQSIWPHSLEEIGLVLGFMYLEILDLLESFESIQMNLLSKLSWSLRIISRINMYNMRTQKIHVSFWNLSLYTLGLCRIMRNINNKIFICLEIIESTVIFFFKEDVVRLEECLCCELNCVILLHWWYSSTFGRSFAMRLIQSCCWEQSPLSSQPYLLFGATFFESGLMIMWSHKGSHCEWWLKVCIWEVRSQSEQQVWSEALKVLGSPCLGKEAHRDNLP